MVIFVHKVREFRVVSDGEHALAGVGVGDLDDGVAAPDVDSHWDFRFRNVDEGLRCSNHESFSGQFRVEEFIGPVSHHFIPSAGETGDNFIHDECLCANRDSCPGGIGDVSETSTDGMPCSIFCSDMHDPIRPFNGWIGIAVVVWSHIDFLVEEIGHDGGIPRCFHLIFIPDHG